MNEKELVKACQRGDDQAFEELIRIFYPYVLKFLLKTSGNEDIAQDMCQETFLKMIRNIEKFDVNGSAGFGTWLVTIAKNNYIDYVRKNNVHFENVEEVQIKDTSNFEREVMVKMEYDEALQMIEHLPPEQGLAIKLKYIENMTLLEIAEQIGVPPKTIKSRIHDGTQKLRKWKTKSEERMDKK